MLYCYCSTCAICDRIEDKKKYTSTYSFREGFSLSIVFWPRNFSDCIHSIHHRQWPWLGNHIESVEDPWFLWFRCDWAGCTLLGSVGWWAGYSGMCFFELISFNVSHGLQHKFFFFGCGSFQAAATRALKKGATFDSVIAMLKGVIPELSCPIVIFTYYNPILKRGVSNFMAIIKQAGVHGNFPA